jgi:hypothetical protein
MVPIGIEHLHRAIFSDHTCTGLPFPTPPPLHHILSTPGVVPQQFYVQMADMAISGKELNENQDLHIAAQERSTYTDHNVILFHGTMQASEADHGQWTEMMR